MVGCAVCSRDIGRGGDAIVKTLNGRAYAFFEVLVIDCEGREEVDPTMCVPRRALTRARGIQALCRQLLAHAHCSAPPDVAALRRTRRFLSCAIEAIMVGAHRDRSGAFRDRYPRADVPAGVAQVTALYAAVMALWAPLNERARAVRGVYERAVENKAPIHAAQAASAILLRAASVLSPAGSAELLLALTAAAAGRGPADMESAALSVTTHLLQQGRRLERMRDLPLFVEFYQWLHRRLAHRFTVRETIDHLTVEDAITAEPDPAVAAHARALYARFRAAWSRMRDSWHFVVCPIAEEAHEDEIPSIGDGEKLFNLVSSSDEAEGDYIVRALQQGFVVKQQSTLMAPGVATLLGSAAVNPLGLLAASGEAAGSVLVQRLRGERGEALTVAPTPAFDECVARLGMAAVAPDGGVSPSRVASLLLRSFVAGRPSLDATRVRTPFAFRSDGVAPDEEVAAALAAGREMRSGGAPAAAAARAGASTAAAPLPPPRRTGALSCGDRLDAVLVALEAAQPHVDDAAGAKRKIMSRTINSKLRQVTSEVRRRPRALLELLL